jgi:hypothetical protein
VEVSRTIISSFILISSLVIGRFAAAQTAAPSPTPTTTGMSLVGTPSGLSYFDAGTPASGTTTWTAPTIYGGYTGANGTGPGGCGNPTSDQTCNSCDGTGLKICNQTSIHPGLYLTMTIRTTTAIPQGARLRWKYSDITGSYAIDNTPTLAANTDMLVQIKWANLCQNANNGDQNCTNANGFAKTLQVGIDSNSDDVLDDKITFNIVFRYLDPSSTQAAIGTACTTVNPTPEKSTEGICDYTIFRGDAKVYISDYAASGNDLLTENSNVKFNRIVLFYNAGAANATTVNNNSPSVTIDLTNNSPNEPSIPDPRVRGLTNGTKYCFALGNMDETGIISYYPPNAVLADANKVCATPAEVVGLLDDKHCFIATATYGSPMAPEVQTFREFRNQYLLTNTFGKSLVKVYYKVGPEAADWISHSSTLKAISLGVLWPMLLFVKLSLVLGIFPAILIALLSTLALAKFTAWALRHSRSPLKGEA